MTTRRVLRAAAQAARFLGCPLRECRGLRLGDMFRLAEKGGARVFWGLWSDGELEQRIGQTTTRRVRS